MDRVQKYIEEKAGGDKKNVEIRANSRTRLLG